MTHSWWWEQMIRSAEVTLQLIADRVLTILFEDSVESLNPSCASRCWSTDLRCRGS